VEEWKSVSANEVLKNGGRSWLVKYNNSLIAALRDIYPQHNWDRVQMIKPLGFWKNLDNARLFIKYIENKLSILPNDQHR
jgi:hypothetical protein